MKMMRKAFLSLFIIFVLPAGIYAQSKDDNFDSFALKFFTDSSFQKIRTIYPLPQLRYNAEHNGYDTVMVSVKDCQYFDIDYTKQSYHIRFYDNEKRKLRDTGIRVISCEGIENGIDIAFYFKLIHKKWFLIKYTNQSD